MQQMPLNPESAVFQPLSETAGAYGCTNDVNEPHYAAVANSAQVSMYKLAVDSAKGPDDAEAALEKERKSEDSVETQTRLLMSSLSTCLAKIKHEKKAPVSYDPIDVISQQVNFIITTTGSLTPGWKLVRSSGPSAPMLSGTRKDTNTLTIALGRPTTAPDGSVAASTPMNNAIVAAILGQALQPRP